LRAIKKQKGDKDSQ